MIKNIKETHQTIQRADGDFFDYIICEVESGWAPRYNLYRIGNHPDLDETGHFGEVLTRFGCELPLGECHRILRKLEPNGTYCVKHSHGRRKTLNFTDRS